MCGVYLGKYIIYSFTFYSLRKINDARAGGGSPGPSLSLELPAHMVTQEMMYVCTRQRPTPTRRDPHNRNTQLRSTRERAHAGTTLMSFLSLMNVGWRRCRHSSGAFPWRSNTRGLTPTYSNQSPGWSSPVSSERGAANAASSDSFSAAAAAFGTASASSPSSISLPL